MISAENGSAQASGTKAIRRELVVLDLSLTIGIVLFGISGNALTVRVLRVPNLRRTSTAFYFTVLALVDILVLLIGPTVKALSAIVYTDERQLRDSHQLVCKSQLFLNYSMSQVSAWVLVAVTIDRMVWVLWPFKARQLCTVRRAALVVTLIVALIAAINARHLWYSTLQLKATDAASNATAPAMMQCTANDTFVKDIYVTYVDPALVTIGPFLVMLIANLLIIHRLRRVKAKRAKNLHKTGGVGNRKAGGRNNLTRMLLCTSIFYLVSSLPYLLLILVLKERREEILQNPTLLNVVYMVQVGCYNLFNLNYAIHFLLYCLAGPAFKAEAFRLLSIRRQQRDRSSKDQPAGDTPAGGGDRAKEAGEAGEDAATAAAAAAAAAASPYSDDDDDDEALEAEAGDDEGKVDDSGADHEAMELLDRPADCA